MATRIV